MFQNILFDLDGTLTDPKEGICKSVQYALHKMGIEEPDLDKLKPFIGPPLIDSFMEFYHMSREQAVEAVEAYRERFSQTGMYENEVYRGIPSLLKACRKKGIRLAVASSKPEVYVIKILEHFKLAEYFDVIVGSELDGRRVKKEEVVEEALRRLKKVSASGINAGNTAMVGDRKFDIEGAQAFGLVAVGAGYGYAAPGELQKAGADTIADSVAQLWQILLEEIPKNSFLRAIYMLAPFALYFLVYDLTQSGLAVLLMRLSGKNLYDTSGRVVTGERMAGMTVTEWITIIGIAAALVGSLALYLYFRRTDYLPVKTGRYLPPAAGAGMTLAVGLNVLFAYLQNLLPVSQQSVHAAQFHHEIPYALGLLLYVIISPIAEELVFRWLMYGRIRRVLGWRIALPASAFFFGCYHGNLLQGIYAFLMGLVMALCYEWSGSLLSPVVLHMSANFIIYTLAFLPQNVNRLVGSAGGCAGSLLLAAVMMVLFWRRTRKDNN